VKRRKQAAFNINFLNHGFFVMDGSVRHHSISGDRYGPCVNDNSPADQCFATTIAIQNSPRLPLPDLPSIEDQSDPEPPIRIMALHAMLYCERLFYLEEVEEIYVADANVYAGRRLHDDIVPEDDISPEKRSFQVSSEAWGLTGKADAVRRRDGQWIAYEHKKGRCRRDADNSPAPWPSDRIQAIAYAVLIAEILNEPVLEARIRYHKDNVTAKVVIDEVARDDLRQAVERARELRRSELRPPVTENERLCSTCSLAPVCLPEEERGKSEQLQLFPARRHGQTLHVVSPKARIGRSSTSRVNHSLMPKGVEHISSAIRVCSANTS